MSHGHDLWMKKYNDSTEAAHAALKRETAERNAKTARLRAARLAAQQPPGKRQADGKRPDELNASNDK